MYADNWVWKTGTNPGIRIGTHFDAALGTFVIFSYSAHTIAVGYAPLATANENTVIESFYADVLNNFIPPTTTTAIIEYTLETLKKPTGSYTTKIDGFSILAQVQKAKSGDNVISTGITEQK